MDIKILEFQYLIPLNSPSFNTLWTQILLYLHCILCYHNTRTTILLNIAIIKIHAPITVTLHYIPQIRLKKFLNFLSLLHKLICFNLAIYNCQGVITRHVVFEFTYTDCVEGENYLSVEAIHVAVHSFTFLQLSEFVSWGGSIVAVEPDHAAKTVE